MKFSNFKLISDDYGKLLAEVTITTGWWLWKKEEVKQVGKNPMSAHWFFLDTGKWTSGDGVESLERAWRFKQ